MKTKEEINDLAEIHANQEMEVYKPMDLPKGTKQAIFTHCLVSYNIGYTQCQEDMADKKYTEEDMIKFAFDTYCYISGIMKVPFNQVSENRTHAEDNLKVFINSLNKQD